MVSSEAKARSRLPRLVGAGARTAETNLGSAGWTACATEVAASPQITRSQNDGRIQSMTGRMRPWGNLREPQGRSAWFRGELSGCCWNLKWNLGGCAGKLRGRRGHSESRAFAVLAAGSRPPQSQPSKISLPLALSALHFNVCSNSFHAQRRAFSAAAHLASEPSHR
jgi:hypothetical protein